MDLHDRHILDLRFLIGVLFTFYGVLLTVYGFAANPQVTQSRHTNFLNIDLWWGLVTLLLGLAFLLVSRRPQRLDE